MKPISLSAATLLVLLAAPAPAHAQESPHGSTAAAALAVSGCYVNRLGWTTSKAHSFYLSFLNSRGIPFSVTENPNVQSWAKVAYAQLDARCEPIPFQ
jgi:hypothetical protein